MKAFEVGFFSIPVTDLNKAQSFYGEVMGWNFKQRDPHFIYVFADENMIGALESSTDNFKPTA